MQPSIHYIAAAYLGDRHFMDPRFVADRWYYLRCQVEMLRRLKHSLTKVTFVINTDVALEVPAEILAAAEVIQRPNFGISYGAWAHAFKTFGSQTSHYILNEDDYLFTQDDFDGLLLEEMQSRQECEMLCGAVYEHDGHTHCPAVSCMLVTSGGLGLIASENGGMLPHYPAHLADPYSAGHSSQAGFADALTRNGRGVEDWLLRWSTAYRMDSQPNLCTRWFSRRGMVQGSPHKVRSDFRTPSMIVSAQAVDTFHPIADGFDWHNGTIHKDGTVTLQ